MRRRGYRPQPKRRSYIPKPGSEKGRPLGVSCFEDKLVELSLKRVLEPIYEPVFDDSSYGYRPGRNPHICLAALGETIQQRRVTRVVEADVRSFFDKVNHQWMEKFLCHRIGDPRVIGLVWRLLKGGILEDGLVHATEEGTPQGSILSPLLSNVYLHYVLDLWFRHRVRKQCRGEAHYFRFADDFVACFEHQDEANAFLEQLSRHESMDSVWSWRRRRHAASSSAALLATPRIGAARNQRSLPCLGLYALLREDSGSGYFKVKRRTSRKKLGQSLNELSDWARRGRSFLRKGEMLRRAKVRIQGHLNYYAITDNAKACYRYVHHAQSILFKWLNRKSQRRAYTWAGFYHALAAVGWPRVRIHQDLNPHRRAEARLERPTEEPDVWGIRLSGSKRDWSATLVWMRYCGTVAKAGGNSEHQLHPAARGVSSLLTRIPALFYDGLRKRANTAVGFCSLLRAQFLKTVACLARKSHQADPEFGER